jgi:hypothetical protein
MATGKAQTAKRMTLKQIRCELENVARAGTLFVDGDLCARLLRPYAERFTNGDDLDLCPETATPVKKALMRLERFSRVPCSTAIHRVRPDMPARYETLLIGFCGSPVTSPVPPHRGRYLPPRLADVPELRGAFRGRPGGRVLRGAPVGRIMRTRKCAVLARGVRGTAIVEIFTPLFDCMGKVTAVLEVFACAAGT